MGKLRELLTKIQDKNTNKNIQNLIIVGLIGIALILTGSLFFRDSEDKEPVSHEESTLQISESDYETRITNQLEDILSAIEGVGRVDVMLTIANESEAEIAYSTTES